MKLRLFLTAVLLAVLVVSGCAQQTPAGDVFSISDTAKSGCISLCRDALSKDRDLSNGPCLSDGNAGWDVNDWVCDVAHSPRQAVDNDPANQCMEFRKGMAHHFVEVDPDCNFIKAV